MLSPLLSSKLYIPPHRPDLVARPRLIEFLDAGIHRKLTLVSAPAGFGKTTLISEWVHHCGCSVAWLTVDKNDNEPVKFLTYLIAALQHIDPGIGVNIQAALTETPSPQLDILLTRLVNEIENLPKKHIIVLDDYHMIENESIHDILNFFVEYLPQKSHLVVVGRNDPPLPISRMRVQGTLTEIRTPMIRFTKP